MSVCGDPGTRGEALVFDALTVPNHQSPTELTVRWEAVFSHGTYIDNNLT